MKRLLVVAFLCSTAAADPAYKSVTVEQKELSAVLSSMGESTDEPVGLVVANKSATVMKLGLQVGDVIRTINGTSVSRSFLRYSYDAAPVLYLDVARNGKPFVVRVAVKLDPSLEDRYDRGRFKEMLADLNGRITNLAFVAISKNGVPSGVQVHAPSFISLEPGDIIRSIDGVAMTTGEQVIGALQTGSDHDKLVVKLDRMDQPLTLTVLLDDSEKQADEVAALAGVAKIKKLSDTSYEIPKDVRDALFANPMAFARSARIVPAVKDGKPDGFKLYAIRPSSVFAALGLANGDTIHAINGAAVASADKALEIYDKLKTVTSVQVALTRRGKPITLTYTIK